MTAKAGASSAWTKTDWKQAEAHVHRLQMRIAKATQEKRYGRIKVLQGILTRSYYAKKLAIKRVTESTGKRTPGVDREIWKTVKDKSSAINRLKQRGYKAQPLRRIYIPKRNGKERALGIPTMIDRAQQALHLLAFEPVCEVIADKHAYGFRPRRCTADAIEQCMNRIGTKRTARWVLEADIEACFDKISHQWLLENVPMDKKMLKQWLKAGYIENGKYHDTETGTPQGGVISPALLVYTLSGLERVVAEATPKHESIGVISYADDFVITAKTKSVLEEKIKPQVEYFLRERGLRLSEKKTRITHIDSGFDFLGFTIRRYGQKVLSKPSKDGVKTFMKNIRTLVKSKPTAKTEGLISLLNPKIVGWANYYRFCAAKETFNNIDHKIHQLIWRWIKRRHPSKSYKWCCRKYFRSSGLKNWTFTAKTGSKTQPDLDLKEAIKISIKRHIKIKSEANPYNPAYKEYFNKRTSEKRRGSSIIMEGYYQPYFKEPGSPRAAL